MSQSFSFRRGYLRKFKGKDFGGSCLNDDFKSVHTYETLSDCSPSVNTFSVTALSDDKTHQSIQNISHPQKDHKHTILPLNIPSIFDNANIFYDEFPENQSAQVHIYDDERIPEETSIWSAIDKIMDDTWRDLKLTGDIFGAKKKRCRRSLEMIEETNRSFSHIMEGTHPVNNKELWNDQSKTKRFDDLTNSTVNQESDESVNFQVEPSYRRHSSISPVTSTSFPKVTRLRRRAGCTMVSKFVLSEAHHNTQRTCEKESKSMKKCEWSRKMSGLTAEVDANEHEIDRRYEKLTENPEDPLQKIATYQCSPIFEVDECVDPVSMVQRSLRIFDEFE